MHAGDPRHGRHRAVHRHARSVHEKRPGIRPCLLHHRSCTTRFVQHHTCHHVGVCSPHSTISTTCANRSSASRTPTMFDASQAIKHLHHHACVRYRWCLSATSATCRTSASLPRSRRVCMHLLRRQSHRSRQGHHLAKTWNNAVFIEASAKTKLHVNEARQRRFSQSLRNLTLVRSSRTWCAKSIARTPTVAASASKAAVAASCSKCVPWLIHAYPRAFGTFAAWRLNFKRWRTRWCLATPRARQTQIAWIARCLGRWASRLCRRLRSLTRRWPTGEVYRGFAFFLCAN